MTQKNLPVELTLQHRMYEAKHSKQRGPGIEEDLFGYNKKTQHKRDIMGRKWIVYLDR